MNKRSLSLSGNSDENIQKVLEKSNRYLESNTDLISKIDDYLWILRSMGDLLPQTRETFWSGHMFPIVETNTKLKRPITIKLSHKDYLPYFCKQV